MAWLRPILLAAGTVFLAALIWRESRRAHQSRDGGKPVDRAHRTTPDIDWSDPQLPISPDPPLVATPPQFMDVADDVQSGPVSSSPAEALALPLPPLRVEWPAYLQDYRARLLEHPATQWAASLYHRHRGRSAEVAR